MMFTNATLQSINSRTMQYYVCENETRIAVSQRTTTRRKKAGTSRDCKLD